MNDEPFYNFQTVLEAASYSIDRLVESLAPGARRESGSYRIGGPGKEKGRSFSISTKPGSAGCYTDFQNPEIKGNAISLVALFHGTSYEEAGRWLARFLGVPPEENIRGPKKRPVPKIEKVDRTTWMICGEKRIQITALTQTQMDFAMMRGITHETLKAFRCGGSDYGGIVMPHFNEKGEPVLLKHWSCDGRKQIFTNSDPVPVLFGKHLIDPVKTGGRLIITEGQWDAMTWHQIGYPAVSIPSGVGNDEWIEEDWVFLNRFSNIFLDFDDDEPGREAETRVRVRLGYERCRSIKYRYKDANDALCDGAWELLGNAFRNAEEAPIQHIANAETMKSKVRDRLNNAHAQRGIPFFLPSLDFEFRPHETSLWFGHTSHGKTSILSNQIAYAASLGHQTMVACFEQNNPMTVASMLKQYTSDAYIGMSPNFDAAYDDLSSKVVFYDSMRRCNPRELISTMILAHKQLGISQFVVDNVMTLEMDRQDNTEQAWVADQFRLFAARYPIHLHLVAHPRKPPTDYQKPPEISEVLGAAEWGNMIYNGFVVYRDMKKAAIVAEMRDSGASREEVNAYRMLHPDGRVMVKKQRDSGDMPMVSYWYDQVIKRAYRELEDLAPYWTPPEESPAEAGLESEEPPSSQEAAED